MKKGQTATEYLIILAVVIVIALIVVGVIGGIPGVGSGTSSRTKQTKDATSEIAIVSSAVYYCGTKLVIRNNNPEPATVRSLIVNNTNCNSSELPVYLGAGETASLNCPDICNNVSKKYNYPLAINWENGDVGFTQLGTIEGTVGSGNSTTTETPEEPETPINGSCGDDNGQTLSEEPTNLCSTGTASEVSGSGPWYWNCTGSDGGTNDTCSAELEEIAWACGDILTDTRDDKEYATVSIGEQCWMQENINIGTLIAGINNQGTSCSDIDKYCYNDDENNCDTYGGLYQWNQAMCGSTTEGAQGICPEGWHVPSHDEWTTLERAVCTSETCETDFPYDLSTQGFRGTNEGALIVEESELFKGLLAGQNAFGTFQGLSSYFVIWTSTGSSELAWRRYIWPSNNGAISRGNQVIEIGQPVRCVKD